MAKVKDSHSEMARARQSDGINVIFDQNSPASSCSRSRSRSSCGSSPSSARHRGRDSHRRRYRSSSSTSSSSRSRSSSHSRSRSHPRCHRPSSRCRCDGHHRYGRGRYRRSSPQRHRAHSHSYSRSPSPDRYSSNSRHYRSRSRSSRRQSRHRRDVNRFRCKLSESPSRTYRNHSKSRSSGRSVRLSLDEKRECLEAAKANAIKILGRENVELPESVKPILSDQSVESKRVSEPEARVRQDPEKSPSQSSEVEPDDVSSPKISPKRKTISFSINNSVVKPAVAAPSCAKVTPRVDIYESRKPYGHWVPVKSGQTSNTRKHTLATLR